MLSISEQTEDMALTSSRVNRSRALVEGLTNCVTKFRAHLGSAKAQGQKQIKTALS